MAGSGLQKEISNPEGPFLSKETETKIVTSIGVQADVDVSLYSITSQRVSQYEELAGNGSSSTSTSSVKNLPRSNSWERNTDIPSSSRQQGLKNQDPIASTSTSCRGIQVRSESTSKDEVDDAITYESESESDGDSNSRTQSRNAFTTLPEQFNSVLQSSSKQGITVENLQRLGKFSKLDRESPEFKIVKAYTKCSHGLAENAFLKIHEIYQKKNGETSKPYSRKPSNSSNYKMLLWCKTTPEIIRHISEKDDSCMAFYDRLSRAFSKPAKDLKENTRQIILLCIVTLGNTYKSPHGYRFWKANKVPHGYDSVKGTGKFIPDWQDNRSIHKDVIVPCGETKLNKRFPSYEIDYNEYMVYKSKSITVEFAVDFEICVGKKEKIPRRNNI